MDEVLTAADMAASNASVGHGPPPTFSSNFPLVSAVLAFSVAQFLKPFTTLYKEKRWDSRRLLGSGGMPSSHSATVAALAVAVGLQEGIGSTAFALAVILASIIMYDASGIRLHAGRQAELLNQIVCELPPEHPVSNFGPLREPLGHTPLQEAVLLAAWTPSSSLWRMRVWIKVALAVVAACVAVATVAVRALEGLQWADSFYLAVASESAFLYLPVMRVEKRNQRAAEWVLRWRMTAGDVMAADLDNDGSIRYGFGSIPRFINIIIFPKSSEQNKAERLKEK